jgi:uncharacterized sodium:solute symporter family permease YidK
MATSLLINNITDFMTTSSIMQGGKLNNNVSNKQNTVLLSFVMIIIALLLKGFIVYLLYNYMVPKIMYSLSEHKSYETIESNFKPISFSESILLVILTNTLFSF